jgi:hypothetical protein
LDQEETIRSKALQTLQNWDTQELRHILASSTTAPAILEFALNHLAGDREPLLEGLLENPSLPDDLRDKILNNLLPKEPEENQPPAPASSPSAPSAEEGVTATREHPGMPRETLIQKIGRMSAVEKIKLALRGNQESRILLIRDANKIVARAVLQSPKLSESEIEAYASAKNVSEEVLRLIAVNRAFRKNYTVVRALVNNPKAPIDITLPLLNRLNDKDMKEISLNRNVPEVIRGMAIKMKKQREDAAKPKLKIRKH